MRDTHRNKPIRVIDLSKESEDGEEFVQDGVDMDDTIEEPMDEGKTRHNGP